MDSLGFRVQGLGFRVIYPKQEFLYTATDKTTYLRAAFRGP